jgi:GTPase
VAKDNLAVLHGAIGHYLTRIRSNSMSAPASAAGVPTLAIVGRPNVGKSTLFNRIIGSRRAIVGDEPGITRDRLYREAEWRGHRLRIVDTGGILPDEKDFIPAEVFRQAKVALEEADAVIMVVDGRTELAAPDLELARLLIRSGKPLFLAVNKIDSEKQQALADEFYRLGIRTIFPVSAEHGRGVDDLLDAILEVLPAKKELTTEDTEGTEEEKSETRRGDETAAEPSETKVAIIGHPNVGKSTLLNRLTGADRAIVSPVPGTTRDAVDEMVERDGQRFRFIDTAGIRRKGKTHLMAEKLSVVMARKHLEAADIALLVIDATEGVSQLDAAIAGYAHESGRSVMIIVNRWDLWGGVGAREKHVRTGASAPHKQMPADRAAYEQRLRYALKFLSYAPVLFVSATTGKGIEKIFPTLEQVTAERRKRIGTGEMNRFRKHVDFDRAPVPARQQVKIYYMTQAAVAPPTFVLFTDRQVKLHFSYQRFLENQIRRAFGFVGTPIWIKNRARE